ncbi:hypothetical protein HD553DRAFT_276406 [Filobasidium floriforme]|uniref:uncharacterized protein n=1 Tax=Filobasidium floriforme TaxID=5210 RepID=UPI001E8ED70A|nr:uncharacterized protein HD553DRAFT_276406 [Filobasidium floriforme]KAH8080137.1 hypothetical protein HD553DRAFT_276406 [Filobasidium floriforme]
MFNNLLASSSIFGLFLAGKVLAGIYVTNPVADTVVQSGQTLTINWVDDGVYPLLGNIGPSSIALFTGSTFQQSWLANIAEEIDVSKVGTVNWAVDPNVGPSGNYYFIRFTSKNLKDTTEAAYPHTAYSAKFTLENMSGSFNGTILSQINATSSSSTALSSRPTSSGTGAISRASSTGSTPSTAQSASETSESASNSAASIGRELSHAGIGAVVLGCMGLGLALCL